MQCSVNLPLALPSETLEVRKTRKNTEMPVPFVPRLLSPIANTTNKAGLDSYCFLFAMLFLDRAATR